MDNALSEVLNINMANEDEESRIAFDAKFGGSEDSYSNLTYLLGEL